MRAVLEHASLPETVRRVIPGQVLDDELAGGSRLVPPQTSAAA